MHTLARVSEDIEIAAEGEQRRLWSWLVLCDDRKSTFPYHHPPWSFSDWVQTRSYQYTRILGKPQTPKMSSRYEQIL